LKGRDEERKGKSRTKESVLKTITKIGRKIERKRRRNKERKGQSRKKESVLKTITKIGRKIERKRRRKKERKKGKNGERKKVC